ncbi:MAG: hypothetical protein J6L00_05440 [Clostridia bacterium]|nr:hypothetical protein [Clostridia bacterium]
MKIAKRQPFTGKPVIHTPSLFGASTAKSFMYRIPVTGERPITVEMVSENEHIRLENGIIYGNVPEDTVFTVTLTAKNAKGSTQKSFKMCIDEDGVLKTPLLGFTTWNAFGAVVTQQDVERSAKQLIESGIADYGYGYVNMDSGWQHTYGGEYDAIMPNPKFPDMKGMCDAIHALGLRCGVYSTPMLTAWGCPPEYESIPGCTVGERDPRFPDTYNGGIGMIHKEKNNVLQWEAWGFDYLKYDWKPVEAINGALMKKALRAAKREIAFCVTVEAQIEDAEFLKNNVNSWRANEDTHPNWENVLERMDTLDTWADHVRAGHFYDLDMLAMNGFDCGTKREPYSEDEELFAYTLPAFFASPIQISTPLDRMTDFLLDMVCNEEMIAINQDALADYPRPVYKDENVWLYKRRLENGDVAYAAFNRSEAPQTIRIPVDQNAAVRDVWQKEAMTTHGEILCELPPHSTKVYRVHS